METHLEVGQDHFSVHVALAAVGGHGDDWRKAIPLPPALAASRLKERRRLPSVRLVEGGGGRGGRGRQSKSGELRDDQLCKSVNTQKWCQKSVAVFHSLVSLVSPIAFTADVKRLPMS